LLRKHNNKRNNQTMTELCFDVMELVGQEVMNIRDVSMNKAKYNSVMWVLQGVFCEAYCYGDGHEGSCQDGDCNLALCVTCFGANDYKEPYTASFISTFKDCLYEYWCGPPKFRFRRNDTCGVWSMGWGGCGPYREPRRSLAARRNKSGIRVRFEIYGNN